MSPAEADNYEMLRDLAMREGMSLFGVADTTPLKDTFLELAPDVLNGLDRAVVVAYHLSDPVLQDIDDGPTKLYYFHYRRVNILLDNTTLRLAEAIQARGHSALPIPASQVIDWENQRAHVSHKHLARAAGIGWIGRNNLLVARQYGSRVRLASVLTDMPLAADEPCGEDCGACRACIASCPSGSIRERPEDFDHVGCYEQIRAMVKSRNIGQNICGLCVKACAGRR